MPQLTTLIPSFAAPVTDRVWLVGAHGVMMPMLRMRMAATKRTGKHMPITGGKHAK